LADAIQRAVAEVPGVIAQEVKVVGFVLSEELTALLKQALEDQQEKKEQK
jgi:predicted DsbA family dithiol-disulfide isomerase